MMRWDSVGAGRLDRECISMCVCIDRGCAAVGTAMPLYIVRV